MTLEVLFTVCVSIGFSKNFIINFRLAASESVQFFQFDQQGNMFVFEPGAGCTGMTTLVRPGDDLIFDSHSRSNVSVEQLSQSEHLALIPSSSSSETLSKISSRYNLMNFLGQFNLWIYLIFSQTIMNVLNFAFVVVDIIIML